VTDARCEAWIRRFGEDRPCGQTVALYRWTDHTGRLHHACSRHAGGLKRRHPAELPERTAPHGTLGLGTPWTRGAFAPADVIAIENAIPRGYRINVVALSRHTFVIVGGKVNVDGWGITELFRTAPTTVPYPTVLAMVERLALHAQEFAHAG
jgi:hypothetical protein